MKKLLLIALVSSVLFSCGKKEDNTNIDALIASKDLVSIKAKRVALQTEITKLDDAIAVLDVKKQDCKKEQAPHEIDIGLLQLALSMKFEVRQKLANFTPSCR